ncbi:transcription termination factor NusA [Mesoplasma syrphidae]|uniref:Transcription termination/antitermination protein NusA n=1 Tax=Mesoplasma syrphidae TaxID=225999 RepID=A0A2K9BN86_9MOLU|nr:transcription termination factor NusA [Mesoplasma syrphidae]AUF83503.1 transcription termination factor NusA [Mesoplasma syrphidae]
MVNGAELLEAISLIAEEKGIDKNTIFEGIVEGFQKAFERFFDTDAIIQVEIEESTGAIKMFQELEVLNTVEDDWLEITPADAKKEFGQEFSEHDLIRRPIEFNEDFSRLAVFQVRQIVQQKIKGAERAKVYAKFIDKQGEIIKGKITGMNEQGTSYLVDIDGTVASLWNQKTINGEKFEVNEYVTLYIDEVAKDNKFSQVMVSRTAPNFLAKLLEQEVPEISEGIVEIKAVSREAGKRAKVAVYSHDEFVDPIGAVVGSHGARINNVSSELRGEKIDVVKWDSLVENFIMNAMAPVRVISVSVDEENGECDVIVPNEQLSLAIGKSGIAARLVANLLKIRVNIYSYANALEDKVEILWNGNISEAELSNPEFLANINKRREKTAGNPRVSKPRASQKPVFDVDALAALQDEIKLENEIEELEFATIPEPIKVQNEAVDEELAEDHNLDEIAAKLKEFENVIEETEETDFDEEEIADYDKYYD